MILHGIEYQRPTSLNMRIMADHVTYSFLAFMKSIFHFCLGCYCGRYSQNGRSNLSSCPCTSKTASLYWDWPQASLDAIYIIALVSLHKVLLMTNICQHNYDNKSLSQSLIQPLCMLTTFFFIYSDLFIVCQLQKYKVLLPLWNLLGATSNNVNPTPGIPQEHNSTPGCLVSVYPRQATHVLFTKWTRRIRMQTQ